MVEKQIVGSRGGEVVCNGNERWRSSAAAYLTPVRSLFLRRTQARSLDSFVPAKCVAPSFELQPWPWFQLACYKNPATTCEFLPSDSSPLSNHLIAFPSPILNYNLIVPIRDARLDRSIHLRRRKKNVCSTILFVWPPIIYSSLKLLICSINANGKKERKRERESETSIPFSLLSAR